MLRRIAAVGPALLLVCPALAIKLDIQPAFNRDVAAKHAALSIGTLREWAEAGAPKGNQAGKPPAAHFAEAWLLGEPDIKLSSFSIPVQMTSSMLTAILIAALAFRRLLRRPPPHLQIHNGCWRTRPDRPLGGGLLKLYKRACTAAHGPFALSPQETVYFIAAVDSAGKELDCGSTYCIHGCDPDTRWWSLTVYKRDHLIPNALNRYSFSKTTVARSADGSWKIYLSPRHQPQNWLPSGEPSGRPTLLLRLYNPGLAVVSGPETAQLPAILKLEKVS
jgi:hypothetical protein